jgi:SM-20-related protein
VLYVEEQNFLGADAFQGLLDYTLSQRERFEPSLVGASEGRVDASIRQSRRLWDLGEFHTILEAATLSRAKDWGRQLGLSAFEPSGVEIEMVAHGHGGFYGRHIDLLTGDTGRLQGMDRIITMVYYLHRKPKPFSGGQLRLYPKFGLNRPDAHESHDIEPEQDKAVVFSSWVAHEVMPIICASDKFEDSRFSINCWVLSRRG